MYVSLKHRFLFYRIPKTASSSMLVALEPHLLKFSKPLSEIYEKYVEIHHTSSDSLRMLEKLQIPISDRFKMIMVIRNPYTRLVSLYNYASEGLASRNIQTFDSFLDVLDARNKKDSVALQLLKSRTYDSQLVWTNDPNTFNLHIFKYENLNSEEIASCLGLPSLSLPKINSNLIPADQCELKTYQREKIYSMYKEEFDCYAYNR